MKSIVPSAKNFRLPQIDWNKVSEDYKEWYRTSNEETTVWENQILKIKELVEYQLRGQYVRN